MIIGTRKPYELEEDVLDYKAGGTSKIKLDDTAFSNGLMCTLKVTHTNTAGAIWRDPKLFSAIQKISIIANGSEHLKTLTPTKLFVNEIKHFGKLFYESIDSTDGADKESYVSFVIPFSMINMVVGEDTILDTSRFNSLNFHVHWGHDKILSTDDKITITAATLKVDSMGIREHTYNKGEPIKYFIENSINEDVTTNTADFPFYLVKDKYYKQFVIAATVDGVYDDTIIDKITVKAGSEVFHEWSAESVRARNLRDLRLQDQTLLKGIYIIDPLQRGRITDMYNVKKAEGGLNKLSIHLSVKKGAGDTVIELNSEEIEFTQVIPNP